MISPNPKVKFKIKVEIKSSQGLLNSEAKKAICRGSGPDWRAGAGARVRSPLLPGLSKDSG